MKTEKHGDSKAFISFTLDNTIKHCMAVIWCARLKLALMQVDLKCKFLSRVTGIVLQGRGVIHMPFTCPAELLSTPASNTRMKSRCCD